MDLKRRTFIGGAGAALGLATLPRIAMAELKLGNASLVTLSDGHLTLPASFIFGPMPEAELAPILADYGLTDQPLTPECNLTLYRDGTNTVLFDAGSGATFMPTAGTLLDSLDAAGVAPEDITHVVFTHAHPDHLWGVLDDFNDPLFTNAAHLMGRGEWDYWWDPDTVDRIGPERAAFAVGAKRRMEAIEDAMDFFDDGDEVLPGIAAVLTPGHTPGHMSFEIRNGSDAVFVSGDAISNHHVAFARPGWESGSDQDMALAAQTRSALLDRLASDGTTLFGFHLPDGGIGLAEKADDGYRFVPA